MIGRIYRRVRGDVTPFVNAIIPIGLLLLIAVFVLAKAVADLLHAINF